MSHEEIKRVMAQPDLRSLMGYRDRTIMEVLYHFLVENGLLTFPDIS